MITRSRVARGGVRKRCAAAGSAVEYGERREEIDISVTPARPHLPPTALPRATVCSPDRHWGGGGVFAREAVVVVGF